MSYISDITTYLRGAITGEWATSIYRVNNINVADDAYSDNTQHRLTAYVVPLDTALSATESGAPSVLNRFAVYLFVPRANDQEASDSWDICNDAKDALIDALSSYSPTNALDQVSFAGAREYRWGRGYYIYEIMFQFNGLNTSAFSGITDIVIYWPISQAADMSYVYETQFITDCFVDRSHGVSRDMRGLRTNNEFTARFLGDAPSLLRGHDFVVIGKNDVIYKDKQSAIDAGREVFQLNGITRYYDQDQNVLGVELIGN